MGEVAAKTVGSGNEGHGNYASVTSALIRQSCFHHLRCASAVMSDVLTCTQTVAKSTGPSDTYRKSGPAT